MGRTQFTFYESWYKAICQLKKKPEQADTMTAICKYALYEEEPDISGPPAAVFESIRPALDAARRKSENGKKSKTKAKESASKAETNESKQETDGSKEETRYRTRTRNSTSNRTICYDTLSPLPPVEETDARASAGGGDSFDLFWEAYPKKVGKEAARAAFRRVKGVSMETMLAALDRQRLTEQWQRENGRFIPHPATWLNQGRWADELPEAPASHPTVDLGDINVVLAEMGGKEL